MTADLAAWLRGAINDHRRMAIRELFALCEDTDSVRGPGWYQATCLRCDWYTTGTEPVAEDAAREHVATCHADDPSLIDLGAKLRILDAIERMLLDARDAEQEAKMDEVWSLAAYAGSILRLLALPYAGRPGYRDEWRP